jgi:hypothetical protein
MPKTPRVRVIACQSLRDGSIRALASIDIAGIQFNGVRLQQHPDGALGVLPPQLRKQDAELRKQDADTGRMVYTTLVRWPKPIRRAIVSAISEALISAEQGVEA